MYMYFRSIKKWGHPRKILIDYAPGKKNKQALIWISVRKGRGLILKSAIHLKFSLFVSSS